jgi:uncharacterized protein
VNPRGNDKAERLAILYCDGKRFRQIVIAGANKVSQNRDSLNKINVFPVPDGDTGTNMSMTLSAAVREMETLKDVSLETVVKAAAWGALMGARGNSGIILAQILAGVAESVGERTKLFAKDIVSAFTQASNKAYRAVLHPTEGTILTVVRETAESAEDVANTERDLSRLLESMVISARASVERTPLLLPKLKDAGVVDAGGLGFFHFLDGMLGFTQGVSAANGIVKEDDSPAQIQEEAVEHQWTYRFCTEFMLKGNRISEESMKIALSKMGDSVVVVGDSRLARVHIHTGEPEEVLRYAGTLGHVSSIKVDDMLVQHTSRLETRSTEKATSVIAVVLGDGFKELFYNAGAELVVDGGPTQNPSTGDFVSAIESVVSSNVIILPNHRNIYPAAVQAAKRSSKNVTVMSTSSAPEGLCALLTYMEDVSTDENVRRMKDAYGHVKVGEAVEASRDVVSEGVEVKAGDFIGISRGKIECASSSPEETMFDLVGRIVDTADEIITVFYGDTVEKDRAEALCAALRNRCEDKDVELYFGGQPYAQYIVGIE